MFILSRPGIIIIYVVNDLRRRFAFKLLWPFIIAFFMALGAGLHVGFGWAPLSGFVEGQSWGYLKVFGVGTEEPQVLFFQQVIDTVDTSIFEKFLEIFKYSSLTLSLGLWAVISGAASCLGVPKNGAPEGYYSKQLEKLDYYLFLSAIMMVGSVIYMVAWLSWPGFIFQGHKELANQSDAFNNIVKSTAIFFGLTFSAVIASFYIPIRYILMANMPKEEMDKRNLVDNETVPDGDGGKFSGIIKMVARTQGAERFLYSYIENCVTNTCGVGDDAFAEVHYRDGLNSIPINRACHFGP